MKTVASREDHTAIMAGGGSINRAFNERLDSNSRPILLLKAMGPPSRRYPFGLLLLIDSPAYRGRLFGCSISDIM
ncbi:hypothetical protein C8R31_101811 [Nitrosospira sp. Nsp2]|nr:hypothetical protein C8R31_101811 [Nitrosospira sp. Nsp2]